MHERESKSVIRQSFETSTFLLWENENTFALCLLPIGGNAKIAIFLKIAIDRRLKRREKSMTYRIKHQKSYIGLVSIIVKALISKSATQNRNSFHGSLTP